MRYKAGRALLVCLLAAVSTACYPDVEKFAPRSPDQPWQSSRQQNSSNDARPKFALQAAEAVPPKEERVEVEAGRAYGLPELIDLAQRSNPDTRIAWEQARQAAFSVGLAESAYLPQLTAEALGGFQHTPLPLPKKLEPRGFARSNTAEILPTFAIKWLLFDFGKRAAEVEAAKQISIASNIGFTGAHQKLIFEVSKAYFALSAAHEELRVTKEALKNSLTFQDSAEQKGKNGLETVTNVAIAREKTARARFDVAQAQALDNDSYHTLLEAMGLTPTLKLQISFDTNRTFSKKLAGDVDQYINQALQMRPDVLAAVAKVRATNAGIASAKASYYPTLGIDGWVSQNLGVLSVDGSSYSHVDDPATGVLFKLSLPLYDGGLRSNEVNIAESKNAEAKEELSKIQDQAVQQVARSYDAVNSAFVQYDSAREFLKASRTAYSAGLDSYQHGVETFTNVLTAETSQAQAESVIAHSYAGVLTAAAALAFSAGELTSAEAVGQ